MITAEKARSNSKNYSPTQSLVEYFSEVIDEVSKNGKTLVSFLKNQYKCNDWRAVKDWLEQLGFTVRLSNATIVISW